MTQLTKDQQDQLQQNLSGMKAGFTLQPDALYVRFGKLQFSFILVKVDDDTRIKCYGCGTPLTAKPHYFAKETINWPYGETTTRNHPFCSDCGCPK